MGWFQWGVNPWGQSVLTHISWDLLWWALAVGILFMAGHAVYVRARSRPAGAAGGATVASRFDVPGLPARIVRHVAAARLFHWVMTVAMLALLLTGFLPVVGLRFAWVTIHWAAGLVLLAALVFHLAHVFVRGSLTSMWVTAAERHETRVRLRRALGARLPPPGKPGKYPVENKLYHNVVALVSVIVVATGLVMMVRIPTPFFARNPYLFSDAAWGVVYVLHGLSGVALVTLVAAHVYFAVRPEKRWITWSMITGWIEREKFLEHHDPTRWVVGSAADQSRS
jgi:formate dehydrogenase subunit gamma